MFCPQCHAEYRPGFTHCTDCDVDLVYEPPREPVDAPKEAALGDPNEDPLCGFWRGDDPRLHAELCTVLDEAGIPHRTVSRTDHLFNINQYSAFQIGVPFSLYKKAEQAIQDAFGIDENTGAIAVLSLPAPAVPEPTDDLVKEANPDDWFMKDATVEIWSGDPPELVDMLGSSLSENQIPFRKVEADGRPHLFVHGLDEARAREIVREIVEGVPPEE